MWIFILCSCCWLHFCFPVSDRKFVFRHSEVFIRMDSCYHFVNVTFLICLPSNFFSFFVCPLCLLIVLLCFTSSIFWLFSFSCHSFVYEASSYFQNVQSVIILSFFFRRSSFRFSVLLFVFVQWRFSWISSFFIEICIPDILSNFFSIILIQSLFSLFRIIFNQFFFLSFLFNFSSFLLYHRLFGHHFSLVHHFDFDSQFFSWMIDNISLLNYDIINTFVWYKVKIWLKIHEMKSIWKIMSRI